MADTVPEDLTYEVEYEGLRVSLLEGWGNRFYVLLVPELDLDLNQTRFANVAERAELARRWCVEFFKYPDGGADGLIFGLYRSDGDGGVALGDAEQEADARMVLHNADGSPAEMSGNGLRCLAHALARLAGDVGLDGAVGIPDPTTGGRPTRNWQTTLRFETGAGLRSVLLELPADGLYSQGDARPSDLPEAVISIAEMGEVTRGPEPTVAQERLARDELGAITFTTRSVGNPHLVVHVPPSNNEKAATATREVLRELGPVLARADEPEHAINVELISTDPTAVDVSERPRQSDAVARGDLLPWRTEKPNRIFMLVWERGVGPTLACGTGAIAAARQAADWQQAGSADWQSINPDEAIEVVMSETGAATVYLSDRSTWLKGPTIRKLVPLTRTNLKVELDRLL